MFLDRRGFRRFGFILAIGLVLALGSPLMSTAAWFNTSQLTDNNYDDEYPSLDGNNVVWEGWDSTVTTLGTPGRARFEVEGVVVKR